MAAALPPCVPPPALAECPPPGVGSAGARGGLHRGQRCQRPGLADAEEREAVAAGENLRHLLSPGAGHCHQGLGDRWGRDGAGGRPTARPHLERGVPEVPPSVTRPPRRRPQPEPPLQRQRAAGAEQQHQAARLQAAPAHRMGLPVRVAPGGGGQHGEGGPAASRLPPCAGPQPMAPLLPPGSSRCAPGTCCSQGPLRVWGFSGSPPCFSR